MTQEVKIILLHHSTGGLVWKGGVPEWFEKYNAANGVNYSIVEREFPADEPYGWANYPYDYWNIWVKNAGREPFMNEPTLEMLTKEYDVISFKHCYPVASIKPDTGSPDIASDVKSNENYRLQYQALKSKMREFPDTKFVVWTGALLAKEDTDPEEAERAAEFFKWVMEEWDEPGDNIFVWDFARIEGDGGLYLKAEFQGKPGDSHPGGEISRAAAPLFGQRIVDVIEGRGDTADPTGAK